MTTGYITITEARRFTTAQTTEWSDTAMQEMIDRATGTIDILTGRTWQGIKVVTDERYPGDDTDILWLDQCDIVSPLTAISIDQAGDNVNYTTVTPAYVNVHGGEGYIVLNRSKAEVNLFKAGDFTVKVSYSYGNATPTDDVKSLCIIMVRNYLHEDAERRREADRIIERLKRKVTYLS